MTPRAIYIVLPAGRNGPGGVCRMVDYYMSEWSAVGRRPSLTACDTTGPVCDLTRHAWWQLWRQPICFLLTSLSIIYARLTNRIALLHIHIAERGSVLRKAIIIYLARTLRIPVVAHMHGASFRDFYANLPKMLQRLVAHAFRQPQKFIVLGSAYQSYFIDVVGLDPARVMVVPNAVPCLGPITLPSTAVPQIAFVGAMIERKGLLELLHALSLLRHLPWTLKIIGDGESTRWQDMTRDLCLSDRIEFCGWLDSPAVHDVLARSDLLILPSHAEGLPMVIIEAMAHCCTVVATPVGSVTDIVEHDVTGLLVPVGDAQTLAEAIKRVLQEPHLSNRLQASARDRYLSLFTMQRMNDQLQDIFQSVMQQSQL